MKNLESPTPPASFTLWDYVVFTLMLVISAAVGLYYGFAKGGQHSSRDFLVGGRSMTAVPVALSLTASFMSAITVLATPVEVYCYGLSFILTCLSFIPMVWISSEIFLPIFYRLGITSTYEYLEMRFNKATRLFGTVLFIIQTLLYTGMVIYAPALALNKVTGLDLWGAVISTGVVCTFYCTLGGLKAVVWTDVFQVLIMLTGFLAVIIQSVISSILGLFLLLFSFDPNPLRRHTFWTILIGGTFVWTSTYGINQAQVQRYVSCKSLFHAKMSLYVNLVSLWAINLCSVFCGLCLYSVYKNCDPWTANKVSAQDQLMPYLVLDILRDHPGLPGLFVAAAYSGTLSTVSSSVNALATVTATDLISPYFSLSEQQLSWVSKGLNIFYGAMCIGMAGVASLMGGLLQAAISIVGTIGGPLLGLFTLGILFPFVNSKGGLAGLVTGLSVSFWVCIGSQIYRPLPESTRPLALETHGCNFTMAENQHNTQDRPWLADSWYSLSYLYFCPVGTLVAIAVGLIVSLVSDTKAKGKFTFIALKNFLLLYWYNMSFLFFISQYSFLFYFQAIGNSFKLDLAGGKEKKSGETNFAFRDIELDITQMQSQKSLT
uniref:Solute carrier family 5 member 8 n=1 Tax=Astyanax mexicanus TaxID=7994 RepID=A0A8B9LWE9_ASTMX